MIASWKSRSTLSWPPIALFTPKAAVTHAGTGPRRHVSNPSSSRCGRRTDTAHWTRPSVWATCQDTVWSDLDQSLHRNQLLTNNYYLSIHPSILTLRDDAIYCFEDFLIKSQCIELSRLTFFILNQYSYHIIVGQGRTMDISVKCEIK